LLVPAALAVGLYVWSLGCGFLADDFLYLNWMRRGLGVLLRHVTVASDPQMIRPLPALGWWLVGGFGWGAAAMHGVSILLHAAMGVLLARLCDGAGGMLRARPELRLPLIGGGPDPPRVEGAAAADESHRGRGVLWACAFVAFPLFCEPVVWLSASFDLWACGLALAAILVAREGGERAALGASVLFSLALLSKESVLLLPLVVAALFPWREVRRVVLAMLGVAALYLACRFLLFAGPGGYRTAAGHSLLWSPDLAGLLRNVTLRLPFRILAPLRRGGEIPRLEPITILVSLTLLVPLLLHGICADRRKNANNVNIALEPRRSTFEPLARIALAVLFALLPVAPVFSIEIDQENSRLLYFPFAVAILGAATLAPGRRRPRGPLLRLCAVALVVYWSAATVWNQAAWIEAGREVRRTAAAMRQVAPMVPVGSAVFIAGHDIWRGAYTLRNAVADLAAWNGIRQDVHWYLGTVASIDRPAERLGRTLFEIGVGGSEGSNISVDSRSSSEPNAASGLNGSARSVSSGTRAKAQSVQVAKRPDDDASLPIDWTPCEAALLLPPAPRSVIAIWPLPAAASSISAAPAASALASSSTSPAASPSNLPAPSSTSPTGAGHHRTWRAVWTIAPPPLADSVTPTVALSPPRRAVQVRLSLARAARPAQPVEGRLYWLPPRFGRYNRSDSAPFFIGPRAADEIVLRLPMDSPFAGAPLTDIGVWLHLPAEQLSLVRSLTLADVPSVCLSPPALHPGESLLRDASLRP
jgi:hypothetical protein